MPLPAPVQRREIHNRQIDMTAYIREDGHYDVESHLVDRKPFSFLVRGNHVPVAPGDPIHDLWIRLTVDESLVVRAIEAASDITPYPVCKEAEATLQVLIGERIVSGWSTKVKERLRGAAGCTHLMEMLIPIATTAIQGMRGLAMQGPQPPDEEVAASKIDTCYAYGRHRELVKMLWPQHYRPEAAEVRRPVGGLQRRAEEPDRGDDRR
jgi:hypothetical protein